MVQNARVTAFTVSALFRENQHWEGVKLPPPPIRIRVKSASRCLSSISRGSISFLAFSVTAFTYFFVNFRISYFKYSHIRCSSLIYLAIQLCNSIFRNILAVTYVNNKGGWCTCALERKMHAGEDP